jgi:hypothetical protein
MKPTSAFPTITITFLVNLDSAPLSSSPTYTVYFLVCLLDELAPPGWFFTSSQDLQLFLPQSSRRRSTCLQSYVHASWIRDLSIPN